MKSKYQTLSEFIYSPFNNKSDIDKDITYNSKYHNFIASNKIKLVAVCEVENSYFIHIAIPSESQKDHNYNYDVVIRFFPEDDVVISQRHLRNYKLQFFSNSPSFMYGYAYLYHKEGYLIEALYNKIDSEYIDTPPEKTNKNLVTSYDKSIYFACRYLLDNQFKLLDKKGPLQSKMINIDKFFTAISDFKSVKLDQALITEERKLKSSIKNINNKNSNDKSKDKKTSTNKDKTVSSITILRKKSGKTKIIGKKKITAKKKI